MNIKERFCDTMLTTGYGAILGQEYCDYANSYSTETKAQLIAAMDVWSTLPLWNRLGEQDKLPESGPLLVTTQCHIERKNGTGSLYSIDLNDIITQATIIQNRDKKDRTIFSVSYDGDYAITHFEYILLDQLPRSRHLQTYHGLSQDPICEHIITPYDLNHYGDGIVHGSWIINQLLTQLEDKANGLKPGDKRHIKFHHPGKLDTVMALYHNRNQGLDLVSHGKHSNDHLIAQMKYLS